MNKNIRKKTSPLLVFPKGALRASLALAIGAGTPCQAQLFSDDLESGVGSFIEVDNSGGANAGKFSASVGSDGLGGDAGGGLMVGGDIAGSQGGTFIPGAWYQINNVSADPQGDIMVEYEVRFGPEGTADDCIFVMGDLDEGNFYGVFMAEIARNNDLIYHEDNLRVEPVVLEQYSAAFNDEVWHRAVVTWTASTSTLTFNMTEIGVGFPEAPLFSTVLDGSSNNNLSLTTLGNIQFGFGTFNDTVIFDNITVTGTPPTDTDGDGLSDAYEIANGLDLDDNGTGAGNPINGADGDPDMDGLSNIQEFLGHDAFDVSHGFGQTMASMPDSDGDGLNDLEEVSGSRNPFQTNVAGDAATMTPGLVTNPNSMDSDGDSLNDFVELTGSENNNTPSNPNNTDTDGDTFADNVEIAEGSDPSVSTSIPTNNPIVWGQPQSVTGTLEDFETRGQLIHAWSAADETISISGLGIDFVPGPSLENSNFTGADPDDRADADYDALLNTANWGVMTQSLIIDGLTVGEDYFIQLWVADTRGCCSDRVKTYDSGLGTPEVMLATSDPQFVIGTFTATETEQELRFVNPTRSNAFTPQYNAIMVRTDVSDSGVEISKITHDPNADTTEISWSSREGQLYEIRKSLDLTGNPSSWPVVMTQVAAAASPATTTTAIDTAATEERAFYVVMEIDN